ncbi:hypothetical protein [Bordetella bronchiseptica]|uniref:hypothetical protein n=1 Tax=Bordetella bronchiseptica TaxID=518 RepID=UPI0012678A2C|nr:hypothetical protein [Bordetella bronchiseptica]
MDDVAEKARRNLIAVSTGICAVWALGIPLDGKLIGAVDLGAVQPWRAWATAIVVLIYFAARFHLAPETADARRGWAMRRKGAALTSVTDTFNTVLESTSQAADLAPAAPAIEPPAGGDWRTHSSNVGSIKGRRATLFVKWIRDNPNWKERRSFDEDTLRFEVSPIMSYGLCIRWPAYVRIHLAALRAAYAPTWQLLEYTVPWLLAFAAAAICVGKLIVSLTYDAPFVTRLLCS